MPAGPTHDDQYLGLVAFMAAGPRCRGAAHTGAAADDDHESMITGVVGYRWRRRLRAFDPKGTMDDATGSDHAHTSRE